MVNSNKISLLYLTKNESENVDVLQEWLSLCPAINEIVNIDDNSADDTVEKLKKLESKDLKVISKSRGLDNDFSSQRNFGISLATNNWIFWIDPDETPSEELLNFINNFDFQGSNYSFFRNDYFLGKILMHGENRHQRFLRLFNKKNGSFFGKVHEVWKSSCCHIRLAYTINHFPHQNLNEFFSKINYYSSIRAQELFDRQKRTNIFEIVIYPLAKFFVNYIFKLGFIDGLPGIIMALGMSFHSFLVRSKLWHLQSTK